MAITSILPNLVPIATVQPNVATTIAQATEDLVNAVVDAASRASGTDSGIPDDTLLQIVVWIVDTAGAIAQDALNLTQSAPLTDTKAQQVADCARTWSVVAAIVAAIAIIIVEIVISIFSLGTAASPVFAIVAAIAATISAVVTNVQAMPSVASPIQVIVIGALATIQSLGSATTPPDQRERIRKDTTDNLRRAMTMIQSAAAQHMPSISVDLTRSLTVADQTSRALQKLLAYLRQRQGSGRMAVVVTELGQLVQTHAALAAAIPRSRL
jgi:hypothetical protein